MKTAAVIRLVLKSFFLLSLFFVIAVQALQAQVEENPATEPSEKYSKEELAQMLAPIALYPDTLLSQVLMASTYPIEVIEADRWIKRNSDLQGIDLDEALKEQGWDPSVKALCHFPTILSLMSDQIAETANIGNAFLAQEKEVLDQIQELRSKAHAQGNLTTNKEQKIIVEKETIIIEPADPSVIYVPYYDPWYIYGPWWYPAYPPYYWGPPGVGIGIGISYWPGFYFGYTYGSWSYFNWRSHNIYIDVYKRPRYVRYDRWKSKPGSWNHDPRHRRGVAYRDKPTARKYGQYHNRTRDFRPEARGFPPSGKRSQDRDSYFEERTRVDRASRGRTMPKYGTTIPGQRGYESPRSGSKSSDNLRQERTRVEPDRSKLEPVQRQQQKRSGIEYSSPKPSSFNRAKQMRQSYDQERQTREQAKRDQQQWSRDRNVFNRVDDGRHERESSSRGQSSRQGWGNAESSGRNRMNPNSGWGGNRDSGSRNYGGSKGHKRH